MNGLILRNRSGILLVPKSHPLTNCIVPYFNPSYMIPQTLMNVRRLASVRTGAVRTSLVLTAACATRASSHLQTAKAAVVSKAYLIFACHDLDRVAQWDESMVSERWKWRIQKVLICRFEQSAFSTFFPKQTLMSARIPGCVLTATASTQRAPSSVSATQDTSARRKEATVKAWFIQQAMHFNRVHAEPMCSYLSPRAAALTVTARH